jgi:hypothetical protein
VVASQQEEVLLVLDLIGEQEADSLKALPPTIHIIAQEKKVGPGRMAGVFEQSEEVVVLPVNVPAYFYGGLQRKQHWLLHEDVAGSLAEAFYLLLGEFHLFARLAVSH